MMLSGQPSRTLLRAAIRRTAHQLLDEPRIQFSFITSVRVIDLVARASSGRLPSWGQNGSQRCRMCRQSSRRGFPDLAVDDSVGFATKAGTPNQIVGRLNDVMNRVQSNTSVKHL
jgi:hypothetical protein